jgi:hypothetical protein
MGHPHHVSRDPLFFIFKLIPQRYFIGYGCSFIGDENSTTSFRTAWGIQFVPCLFFMIGLPFLPESPRWLVKVDRVDEALHILAHIQADGNLEDPYVVTEYEEIISVLTAERLAPKGWRKFVYGGMWRRTLAGFSVQAWQQLSGANVSGHMTNFKTKCLTNTASGYDILRGVHLLHGQPLRKHQPSRIRRTIRPIHPLLQHHVFLRRQDRATNPPRLGRNSHGFLPLRCRRDSRVSLHLRPR